MRPGTARTITSVCAIITVALAVLVAGGGIVWKLSRLETRVDAIYAKVESIEEKLDGTANPQSPKRVAGVERDQESLR